jgi:NADP-dependent 3-hydroxy acid dehydrogenase YdfG
MDKVVAVTGASRGIGAAIGWLLSGEASYVTGTFMDLGGGT